MTLIRESRGYSLTELLVVLMIMGLFLLVSIPNLIGMHENYVLSTNATGVASYLRLGRMKAVGNNVSYVAEIDPAAAIRAQCPNGGSSTLGLYKMIVVY